MTPISKAFRELRRKGYFAKQNFWCCQTCALEAIPNNTPKYVYYHKQDIKCFKKTGKLYLKWRSDTPQEIVQAFEKQGLKVEWDGDRGHTIKILTV